MCSLVTFKTSSTNKPIKSLLISTIMILESSLVGFDLMLSFLAKSIMATIYFPRLIIPST